MVPTLTLVTVPVFLVKPQPDTVDSVTFVAPVAIPSSLVLSEADINPAAEVVAAEYVVSVAEIFTLK